MAVMARTLMRNRFILRTPPLSAIGGTITRATAAEMGSLSGNYCARACPMAAILRHHPRAGRRTHPCRSSNVSICIPGSTESSMQLKSNRISGPARGLNREPSAQTGAVHTPDPARVFIVFAARLNPVALAHDKGRVVAGPPGPDDPRFSYGSVRRHRPEQPPARPRNRSGGRGRSSPDPRPRRRIPSRRRPHGSGRPPQAR